MNISAEISLTDRPIPEGPYRRAVRSTGPVTEECDGRRYRNRGVPHSGSAARGFCSNEVTFTPGGPFVPEFRALDGVRETHTRHRSDSHVHVFQLGDDVTADIDESGGEEDPDPGIRRGLPLLPAL